MVHFTVKTSHFLEEENRLSNVLFMKTNLEK